MSHTGGIHDTQYLVVVFFFFFFLNQVVRSASLFVFFHAGLKISPNKILGKFFGEFSYYISQKKCRAVRSQPYQPIITKKKKVSLCLLLREDNVTSPLLLFYDYDYTRMYRKKRMQTCNTVSVGHTVFGQPYGSDIHFP